MANEINYDANGERRGNKRKRSIASEDPVKEKKAKAKNMKKETNSPVEWKPAGRVAKMKQFFENKSKNAEESRINQTSRTSSIPKKSLIPTLSTSSVRSFNNNNRNLPKLAKTTLHSKSPTYKIRFIPKLVITPTRRSIGSPAKNSRSRFSRISSCSEYLSESSNYSQSSRSHSTSEIECHIITNNNTSASVNSTKQSSKRLGSGNDSTKPYFITSNRKTTLHRNSSTGESAISKRRSVGIAAKYSKSPIKPVRELRKVFSSD